MRRAAQAAASERALARPHMNSFVSRCVRSWITAGASATDFLVTWTPLRISEPWDRTSGAPDRARRAASSARRVAERPAQHPPSPFAAVPASAPIAIAGGAAALRARYPLVSALLAELAAPGRDVSPRRSQRRR